MTYIFIVTKNQKKAFHLLCIFYLYDLAILHVYLTFITQYSNILLKVFSLVLLLFNLHAESKIMTFVTANGRPDILTRNVSNEKFIK